MVPKFRGKRKDNGKWVVGVPIPNSFCNVVHMIPIILTDKVAYPPERLHEYLIEIVPETLGQSTGLKDKNDVEIFEGDVIFYAYFETNANNRLVKFVNGQFIAELIRNGYHKSLINVIDDAEIIGNIYEHPELLEVK